MQYREIVAVTGLGGLFQLLTTKSDGAIVRNIADKTTKFISARQHNVTPLESIEVYTTGDNVRLHEVFQKMQEHEEQIPLPDAKTIDNNGIKSYFKSIFPDFDEDRVYVSDMKKMLKWYDMLKANDLLHFEMAAEEGSDDTEGTENAGGEGADNAAHNDTMAVHEAHADNTAAGEETEKKAPKKKKADDSAGAAVETEEKPAAKKAPKKKTEE